MSNYTPRLKKILKAHKCCLFRQGKGDHEFWYSPINGHKFVVDSHIRSRDMANVVLKQAGITDERFD
jgi:hypothetical protein